MSEVRRALPTVPLASCAGLYMTLLLVAGGMPPWVAASSGVAVLVVSAVTAYRAAAGWPERTRRLIGYATAILLGLAVGGALALAAMGVGLCRSWGETCEPDELKLVRSLGYGALAAAVGIPGVYALADTLTRNWS